MKKLIRAIPGGWWTVGLVGLAGAAFYFHEDQGRWPWETKQCAITRVDELGRRELVGYGPCDQ
jgi:hypothetical protein